jgi:hypothetical protein
MSDITIQECRTGWYVRGKFAANEGFAKERSHLERFFHLAMTAAIGHKTITGDSGLFKTFDTPILAFRMNRELLTLVKPSIVSDPRVVIEFSNKRPGDETAAVAKIEISGGKLVGGIPFDIFLEVHFPDQILGLENLTKRDSVSMYRGLLFNLTPGELSCNLYGVFEAITYAMSTAVHDLEQCIVNCKQVAMAA